MRLALSLLLMLAAVVLAAPAASATEKLDWHDCDDGFQCATAAVPQDYAKPHGPKVRLAVIKHPAVDQEHRIGSLFLNPGGPGVSGIDFVRLAPPAAFQVLSRFDWIGWDPRGVGASRPAIDCDEPPAFVPMTPDTFDLPKLLARGRALSRLCLQGDRRFLASVNTGNSARDLDWLRAAVGERKLNYLGISWGGQLGETYTSLFPGRTRALLLDSPVDADINLNRPLRARLQQNASFEHSLQRFLAWADISEDDVDALLEDDDDGRVQSFIVAGLYSKLRWPALAAVLRGEQDLPDPGDVADADDVLRTQLSVERRYPRRLRPYIESAEDIFAAAPHFARGTYEGVLDLFWPVRARGAFYGPFRHAESAPPALVLHTTHDPAAPYAWGKRVVRDLGNARLLTYRGDGHQVITDFNPCVLGAAVAYFNDLQLPPPGASCDQAPVSPSSKKSSSIVRSSSAAAWTR
jgi:pimeloyl-ACP methyl ester carboxylesterase